ncbi:MAG: hypothetical protein II984_05010 [Clostridia bacterium]|nr:hypothetical protein [Clostridia bacterium]
MKNKFLFVSLLILVCSICLFSCGIGGNTTVANYNDDIKSVVPENIDMEHFRTEENISYYTSEGLALWMEVNGEFLKMDYFSLEGNKRVYDNLYFYEDDYFFMITDDSKDLYASLSSPNNEYCEEEKQSGEDIQINIKKSGIYKLTFDVDTLKFDIEYKSEIETPVYYTIKNCTVLKEPNEWIDMSINTENEDEFVLENLNIEAGEFISFFSNIHTSNYKVTLDESSEKYGFIEGPLVKVNFGGNYNVYINKKTYKARLELLNPDSASYGCIYYDGSEFIELTPYESDVPYIFRQRITVDTKNTTSLPKFYTLNYKAYDLTVVDTENIFTVSAKNYYYFKEIGTYELIINLKTFEISAVLMVE